MKKLNWLIILLLLLAIPASAGNFGVIAGGGVSGGDACVGGETLGWTATETTLASMSGLVSRAMGTFTASCTGDLDRAYIYHQSTYTAGHTAQLAVYLDSGDGVPNDLEDTRQGQSATVTSTVAAEWLDAAFASGSVVKGSTYWMVLYTGAAAFDAGKGTSAGVYSDYDSACAGYDGSFGEITGGGTCTYPTDDDVTISVYATLKAP